MSKYNKNEIIKGCVTGIEKYGIVVSLDEYYSGLIHISEISDNFVRNINDLVKIGETIKVKVVDIDDDNYHVKLSIKNINYKVYHIRSKCINETKNGFRGLEKQLPKWIEMRKN